MNGIRGLYRLEWRIFSATAASLLLLILFPQYMRSRTEGALHPHGYCYVWDDALVTSHVTADLLIGVAYVAISGTLAYLVYRLRALLPFHWMFLAFGLFILTCGATHFMDVWTLWHADFWASAALKIVTAVASVATALALPPLIPQTVGLFRAASLANERETALAVAEREREAAEAQNRAKDLFLATLSHELRTPLNAIGGWTQILGSPLAQDHDFQEGLAAIQRNVALQTRLVEDLLDVSAILTGRLHLAQQPVNVSQIVRDAVDAVSVAVRAKSLRLTCDLPSSPVLVDGDPQRLSQVLTNLLGNALKFTPEGGRIEVTVRVAPGEAVLSVRDTGIGIAADFLPRVFETFEQADQSSTRTAGGLGLGLPLVRHIVERHGGRVRAESGGAGRGATFVIQLPLAAAESTRPQARPTLEKGRA